MSLKLCHTILNRMLNTVSLYATVTFPFNSLLRLLGMTVAGLLTKNWKLDALLRITDFNLQVPRRIQGWDNNYMFKQRKVVGLSVEHPQLGNPGMPQTQSARFPVRPCPSPTRSQRRLSG